jgi:hypothetical protein
MMKRNEKKMTRQVKKTRFAKAREVMAEYGFRLQTVMCGKIVNGRYFLTNRSK